MTLALLFGLVVGQTSPSSVAAVVTSEPLSEAALLALKSLDESSIPAAKYHVLTVEGRTILVAEEVLPLNQLKDGAAFLLEAKALLPKGQDTVDFGQLTPKARRTFLASFSTYFPRGIDPQSKGQARFYRASNLTLTSGGKEIDLHWTPGMMLPSTNSEISADRLGASGEIAGDRGLLFSADEGQIVLQNIAIPERDVRALWGSVMKAISAAYLQAVQDFGSALSLLNSALADRSAELVMENGQISASDKEALSRHLKLNFANYGFSSASDVDLYLAGALVKKQQSQVVVTIKDGDRYIGVPIDLPVTSNK